MREGGVVDNEKRLRDIEARLSNIEAALRLHGIWPEHLRNDPLYLDELKRDFKERGVEAIHDYNRSRDEEAYREAQEHGDFAEALVYRGRVRRKGYLYKDQFYFRWGNGLRAVMADKAEVVFLNRNQE